MSKRIPVDTGRILLVDPCHLEDDMLTVLLEKQANGVTLGVIVDTAHDGWFAVVNEDGPLHFVTSFEVVMEPLQ